MASDLFVVIPTAGRPDLLQRTLISIEACRKPPSYRKTIVVENGRKGTAKEIVNQFSARLNAQYLYVEEGNKSNALNAAIRALPNALLFLTDDDVRLHPDLLCIYSDAAQGKSSGEFYGGPVKVDYEKEPEQWLKAYLPHSAVGWPVEENIISTHGIKGDFLGFNWAAFKDDIERAGWFDPNFGPGSPTKSRGQETEMQHRLLKLGLKKVFLPGAVVWHYVPPERSSPEWILQRKYQEGITAGLTQSLSGTALFGDPLKRLLIYLKIALLASLHSLRFNPHAHFNARYHYYHLTGYVHGLRSANQIEKNSRNLSWRGE